MKLHLDNPSNRNLVTGYGAGFVAINHRQYEASLILLPDRIVEPWCTGGFEALAEQDFEAIRTLGPEILLLGTGNRRTFNILMAEGRRVAAALLIETAPS
jgi:uncharacterized protein